MIWFIRPFAKLIPTSDFVYKSGYVCLIPIRNQYIACNTLWTSNSISVTGERAILKKIPVNAGCNKMAYAQQVLGMDHKDCSNQTLSRMGCKIKGHAGNIVNLQRQHMSVSIVSANVADEWALMPDKPLSHYIIIWNERIW